MSFSKGPKKYTKNIENFGMCFPNGPTCGGNAKIGALTATMCCPNDSQEGDIFTNKYLQMRWILKASYAM